MPPKIINLQVSVIDGRITIGTSMLKPTVGGKMSDLESVALHMITAGQGIGCHAIYNPRAVATYALCRDLTDPEALGWEANQEIRNRAREAMGV